jgi:flagellar M-ring protein FliF
MAWSDYWNALGARARIGICVGAALIAAVTVALAMWLLRDPYVSLAAGLDAEQLNELSRQLDTAKLDYRVDSEGESVAVPRSQFGKARAAASAGPFEVPPSVGLELFKETDFSSTDFAQRINYQRALQGELTRTIQSIDGVRKARVHVILPEAGLFKRTAAKATAAVSLLLQPGTSLDRSQVAGIQRLVAASVPEIQINDVVVLDETGASLTRAASDPGGELSSAQLDLKRQADQYLETKLQRLFQELTPAGAVSLSVDTTLDDRQLRVTTEEPIAVASQKGGHVAGVLVKERQSQRSREPGLVQMDASADDGGSSDWEYEYKVGNRVEQMLLAPGSIKRVTVAVALQGMPPGLSGTAVEDLVAHAVGMDRARGDSVSVLLLPAASNRAMPKVESDSTSSVTPVEPHNDAQAQRSRLELVLALAVLALACVAAAWRRLASRRRVNSEAIDEDAVLARVRQWLNEGAGRGRI